LHPPDSEEAARVLRERDDYKSDSEALRAALSGARMERDALRAALTTMLEDGVCYCSDDIMTLHPTCSICIARAALATPEPAPQREEVKEGE
jgi:Arc/MetJ-type ribon-helix-helix transcriptional regulator